MRLEVDLFGIFAMPCLVKDREHGHGERDIDALLGAGVVQDGSAPPSA